MIIMVIPHTLNQIIVVILMLRKRLENEYGRSKESFELIYLLFIMNVKVICHGKRVTCSGLIFSLLFYMNKTIVCSMVKNKCPDVIVVLKRLIYMDSPKVVSEVDGEGGGGL